MDITAVLLDYPPRRWIGSELATHAALKHLAQAGHRVRINSYSAPDPYTYDGLEVVPRTVPIIGTDLIITHPYMSPVLLTPVQEMRARLGGRIPLVVMAHNSRDYTLWAMNELQPQLVVPNSLTTVLGLGAWASQEHVVRPPLGVLQDRAAVSAAVSAAVTTLSNRPRTAGYVNSAAVKGGRVLAQLAAMDRRGYGLLGVKGGYGEQFAPVQYSAQLTPAEMTESYFGQIRVHVQPSLDESWGMTALEALAHGCGVVATALPGPMEALSGAPARWVRWLAPGETGGVRVLELHRAVLEMIDRPAPTSTELQELVEFLGMRAEQSRQDRERFGTTVQTLVERNRLLL